MTSRERERTLDKALFKMSSTSSGLVKDALGIKHPENNPRQETYHAKTIKAFAKELQESGVLGEKTESVVANMLRSIEDTDTKNVKNGYNDSKSRPDSGKKSLDRPSSGRTQGYNNGSTSRPLSAKQSTRPQSAKLSRPLSGRSRSNSESKIINPNQKPRPQSGKIGSSQYLNADQGLVTSRSNSGKSQNSQWSGRSDRSIPSRQNSSKSQLSSRASSARSRTGLYDMRYFIKISFSFPNIIPKSTQMYTLYTILSFYITFAMFHYIGQG